MYRYFSTILLVFSLFIQKSLIYGFEGNITFVKQTYYDTTYYTFSVKEKMVRIDEINNRHEIMQSLIINLQDKKITALSPSQKLFTTIEKFKASDDLQKDFSVIKSQNYKYIDGHKCFLWRVRNTNLNTDMSFWVAETDFSFYSEVMSLLGRTEDYSKYCLFFNQIPDAQGYFPMMVVEKTLLRDEKMKVSVQEINPRRIDNKLFVVPRDYKFLRY